MLAVARKPIYQRDMPFEDFLKMGLDSKPDAL
jgi:hypothetical protein